MVIRYGETTTDDVEEAMKKIEFCQMNMLGFILNGVKTKHTGKYYSKYKYKYYKYGKNYGGYGSKPSEAVSAEDDKSKHIVMSSKSAEKADNKHPDDGRRPCLVLLHGRRPRGCQGRSRVALRSTPVTVVRPARSLRRR